MREGNGKAKSPRIQQQREFYDQRWSQKEHASRLQLERTIEILQGLLRVGKDNPRILELGCGTGWLTGILGRFGPATGVELSDVATQKASRAFPDVEFRTADITAVSGLGAFDAVVSHEVIEHLEDQAAHIQLIRESLVSSGIAILTTPNGRPSFRQAQRKQGLGQPIENWLTQRDLSRLFEAQQFDVLESRTIAALGRGTGVYGLVTHAALKAGLRRIGLLRWYEGVLRKAGFGRHLFVVARRR